MNEETNWPRGLKRTKTREAVYSILTDEILPVSANVVSDKLHSIGMPICLSTIYRVLDSFCKYGLAHKTVLSDTQTALFDISPNRHTHYAVCCNCHCMTPIDICPVEVASQEASVEKSNFHILGHNFELYGYCDDCFKKTKKTH